MKTMSTNAVVIPLRSYVATLAWLKVTPQKYDPFKSTIQATKKP
jgi:hypothetical protein